MDKLKNLLHELRCDIVAAPKNEENKIEIENAQETLNKAWTELLRLYNVVRQSEQLSCPHCGQLEPCAGNSPEICYHPKVC